MSEMTANCPQCGAVLGSQAPHGLCPKCLMVRAAATTEPAEGSRKPEVPPAPEQLAPSFPDLEVLSLIGQGGMGFVYRARQTKLDRLVALKILPDRLAKDPSFAERFAREARLLAKLNHPHIVGVHDFGQANGWFYLLMEYVDGVNLRQAMLEGRFTPSQALSVVPSICEALQFAHEQGVLHRDIKPENILLDRNGRVKIADFGVAKLLGEEHPAGGITATGATLGTPHYMAPEQFEKPSAVDHRADIYSLGVVFYEMLTGELPLGRFAPPSEKSAVDARVDEIVLRALQKERELRQQSAEQMKTEVETVVSTEGDNLAQSSQSRSRTDRPRKTSPCLISDPERLQSFKGRLSHPFSGMGHVFLGARAVVFKGAAGETVIPLETVRGIREGTMDWWSWKESPVSFLCLMFEDNGVTREIIFKPAGPWAEPLEHQKAALADWAEALRQAVSGRNPQAIHPHAGAPQIAVSTAPRWLLTAALVGAPLGLAAVLLGAAYVSSGESLRQYTPVAAGSFLLYFGLLGLGASLYVLACFFWTRSALRNGHWKRLVQSGPHECVLGSYAADLLASTVVPIAVMLTILAVVAPGYARGALPKFAIILGLFWAGFLVWTLRRGREPAGKRA